MKEYEETMKAINRMTEISRKAQLASDMLNEKLIYSKMQKDLSKMYRDLLKMYYDYENAINLSANIENCPDCGSLIRK